MSVLTAATVDDYTHAFDRERGQWYPTVAAFEQRCGYAVDRDRLESAARVLACPVKAAPPNWQHGRVLYAVTRHYLAMYPDVSVCRTLDIGTAKGFSALCLWWAVHDAGRVADAYSVDVIDPGARVRRNTVAEVDGLRTVPELVTPWPDAAGDIAWWCMTGVEFLRSCTDRIHVAFVDGKHTGDVVRREGRLLAMHQHPGDVVVFDDVQIPGVRAAVGTLRQYAVEYLSVLPTRVYAIARRVRW